MTVAPKDQTLRAAPAPRHRGDDLAAVASAYWRFRRLFASSSRSQREHALEYEWAVAFVHDATGSGLRAGELLAALAAGAADDADLAALARGPVQDFLLEHGGAAKEALSRASHGAPRLLQACEACALWTV